MAGIVGKVSTGNVRSAEITVWGLRSLDGALKDLAPDLRRQLYKDLGHAGKVIQRDAQARTASALAQFSAGSPIGSSMNSAVEGIKLGKGPGTRNVKDPKTGETVKKRGGGRAALFGFRISQNHGFGAIAEFARQSTTPQGAALVATLANKFGAYGGGRLMWAAMEAKRHETETSIADAVKRAEMQLQERVDKLTVGSP